MAMLKAAAKQNRVAFRTSLIFFIILFFLVEKLQGLVGHGFSLRFFPIYFYMVFSLAPPQNNNRPGRTDNTCSIHKSDLLKIYREGL
jgi:hypothetical protein